MQKIIVPTDFSATAMKAVTYAAEIAQKTGATVYLLHAMERVTDTILEPVVFDSKGREEFVNERLHLLDTLKQSVAKIYPDIKIETELAKGTVINSILDFAEGLQADLIVMGTTGAGGLKEIFMGSVAAGTIGKTKIPVLTVPVSYEMEEPDAILFATNHFEEKKELLKPMVELATLYSAFIHVTVFVEEDEALDYMKNVKRLNRYLDFLRETFPGNRFKGEVLEGKDFELTVDRYDNKNEVDIIAMITYPKKFLERLLKKSATKKMAFHSTIPLLAIPV